MALELDQLQHGPADWPSEVRNRMGELWKQTSEIATDLQSLSHELHSARLELMGVADAMRVFCKELGQEQKVEIDFQTHELPSSLPPDISLCLFRVLQEALHNSVKHSGVRAFEVRLWGTLSEIHLTVRDSGVGFDAAAARVGHGLGLISMEERLRLLSGTIRSNRNRTGAPRSTLVCPSAKLHEQRHRSRIIQASAQTEKVGPGTRLLMKSLYGLWHPLLRRHWFGPLPPKNQLGRGGHPLLRDCG